MKTLEATSVHVRVLAGDGDLVEDWYGKSG